MSPRNFFLAETAGRRNSTCLAFMERGEDENPVILCFVGGGALAATLDQPVSLFWENHLVLLMHKVETISGERAI